MRSCAAEIGAVIKEVEDLRSVPARRACLFDDVYAEPTWNLREQRDLPSKSAAGAASPRRH